MVQNAGTIQCRILIIEEILHDLVFHLCQVDQLAVFGDGAAFQIQGKWAAFDHRRLFVLDKAHADTAIDRVHSGCQFRGGKRLCDIVVRPEHQPADLIHFLCSGSQHNDADGGALFPQLFADGKAVNAGHHNIQQDNVKIAVFFFEHTQCVLAAADITNVIAGTLEVNDDKVPNHIFIFTH